jgi:hypothetical protein
MAYAYNELITDLEIGHEIEFYYKGNKYSITHNNTGWFLSQFNSEEYQSFTNYENLLKHAKIELKTLKEIWSDIKLESIF